MANIRSYLIYFLDIFIRIPPLFFIDEIFRLSFGIHFEYRKTSYSDYMNDTATLAKYVSAEDMLSLENVTYQIVTREAQSYKVIVFSLFKLLISILGVIISLCIFMLKTKQLLHVYMYILSVGCIFVSHIFNNEFLNEISSTESELQHDSIVSLFLHKYNGLENLSSFIHDKLLYKLITNIIIQGILSGFFLKVHLGPSYKTLNTLIPISFSAPSILFIFSLHSSIQDHLAVFSTLLPLALINYAFITSIFTILSTLINAYQRAKSFVTNFGLSALLEQEWTRLNVPNVLRIFWILRIFEHLSSIYIFDNFPDNLNNDNLNNLMIIKYLLVTGCETMTAVLGMTSIVSLICHYIGALFKMILQTDDSNDNSIGTVSAILFYILALQTGLTELEFDDRFVRLCRNFCLLVTALLHFIHNIVNPILMSLSASHNPSLQKHLRALIVCSFLVIYPTVLLYYLWKHLELSTWLLAVSAFSIEAIVKVLVSLMIYCLFLIDAWRKTFWEELDDYVYYIRAFGNTIEFCFGIFLFFNGAWILLFESGGSVRAAMMCIHAYFNIWCEAKNGWSVFMKRKTAVQKINSLPEASVLQLREFDDVCAICYQDMTSAKITRCHHFFHGVCLRKWLYVQDRCPLCHEILYKVKPKDAKDKSNDIIVYMQRERDQHQPSTSTANNTTTTTTTNPTREQGCQTDDKTESNNLNQTININQSELRLRKLNKDNHQSEIKNLSKDNSSNIYNKYVEKKQNEGYGNNDVQEDNESIIINARLINDTGSILGIRPNYNEGGSILGNRPNNNLNKLVSSNKNILEDPSVLLFNDVQPQSSQTLPQTSGSSSHIGETSSHTSEIPTNISRLSGVLNRNKNILVDQATFVTSENLDS